MSSQNKNAALLNRMIRITKVEDLKNFDAELLFKVESTIDANGAISFDRLVKLTKLNNGTNWSVR